MKARQFQFVVLGMIAVLTGCSTRELTITRTEVINTDFQPNGAPMDVDVVTVFPSDLKGDNADVNAALDPSGGITSDVWFDRKPTKEAMKDDEETTRFRLKRKQIFSFTGKGKEDLYGVKVGGQVRGAKYKEKGEREIVIKDIPVEGNVHDKHAVIYVFGRFTDANGRVLPTQPAKFWKIGDWTRNISVRISEKAIEITSPPRFGRSDRTASGE